MWFGPLNIRRAERIDFRKYMELMLDFRQNLFSESPDEYVQDIVGKSLEVLYGNKPKVSRFIPKDKELTESEKLDRRRIKIYDEMQIQIMDAITKNQVTDEFISNMNNYQEEIREQNKVIDEKANTKSALYIPNEKIKELFSKARKVEKLDIPEETKNEVIDALRLAANSLLMSDIAQVALKGPEMATAKTVQDAEKAMSETSHNLKDEGRGDNHDF